MSSTPVTGIFLSFASEVSAGGGGSKPGSVFAELLVKDLISCPSFLILSANWLEVSPGVLSVYVADLEFVFHYWQNLLEERRDVFLGYCSSSATTAASIKRFLLSIGARVLDWQTDFIPGRTILDQIEQAAVRSIGGVFLFLATMTLLTMANERRRFLEITWCLKRLF